MRLIDADKMLRQTGLKADFMPCGKEATEIALEKWIEHQKTAYDVDNVVKQLELHKACYEKKATEYDEWGDTQNMDISDSIALAYGKAIEIVKAGGANE